MKINELNPHPMFRLLLFLMLFSSFSFALEKSQKEKSNNPLQFNIVNYPKCDGSTSTRPLGIILGSRLLGISYEYSTTYSWNTVLIEKHIHPVSKDSAKMELPNYIYRKINHYGTHQAYENLIIGVSDLILVARAPSEDELEMADKYQIRLEYKPVALDAFIFLLNKSNPVNNLTIDQIREIYSGGNLTTWNQLGGDTTRINAYQREDNSGSQELMKSLVMKDLPIISGPTVNPMILWNMTGPINKLAQDTGGLGYSVYYYEENMATSPNIKKSAINGIIPNYENIKSKKYPLISEVYAVIRKNTPKSDPARQLYDWLFTREGQELVQESGYIPIRY